ncbi:hypothetical protein PHISP_06053 [Aspergillus sp. HF37]|nr:hypothetical protein PHISP_06053 [Aspergillus sp. HF37]
MELLCCLRFNWTLAWDPDTWGVDMDMDDASSKIVGDEELWIHRIIYICAKVSDFRSPTSQHQSEHPDNNLDRCQRCQQWNKLKGWCDRWQDAVPRSMKPLSNVAAPDNSTFPEVWLVNRPAIIARLFYHTAQILLAKTHPLEPGSSPELHHQQQKNARDLCGIVAHMSGRGMTSFPIWFFIIGAKCLVQRESQVEALGIVDDVLKDNSLRAEYIKNGLREAWGWDWDASTSHQTAAVEHSVLDSATTFATRPEVPSGLVNPIMATADFSVEGHPYGNYYIPSLSRIDGDPETVGPTWFT